MLAGGSRLSLRLKECDRRHLGLGLGLGLGFYSSRIVHFSSLVSASRPPSSNSNSRLRSRVASFSSSAGFHPQGPASGDSVPTLSDCFSQREETSEIPDDGMSSVAGGIVALGKFDALHIGHRELAIQASKAGAPFLLSFVGMAEVLGWEPRTPIVAKCDRPRVLSSWSHYCGNATPIEFELEFSSVRYLSPRQFVEKLAKDLGVQGVVAGENYRFGYRAAGDAPELVRLCGEYGMDAYIINSVMDKNQGLTQLGSNDVKERGQVSSTRVRYALGLGDMKYVAELLGRPHRLMLKSKEHSRFTICGRDRLSAPKACLLNLAPRDGIYDDCFLVIGHGNSIPCRVTIDKREIFVQMEAGLYDLNGFNDLELLSIEFGCS